MSFNSLVSRPFSQQAHHQQRLRRMTVIHQLCQDCLKRTASIRSARPPLAARRSLTTSTGMGTIATATSTPTKTTQQPAASRPLTVVEAFRQELHRPSYTLSSRQQPSSIIRKSIERRESRKQLLKHCYLLSKKASAAATTTDEDLLLAQITHRDIEFFLSKFTNMNPDEPTNQHAVNQAFIILENMKADLFPQAPFRWQKDGETMICLAAELNKADRADQLLTEWIDMRRRNKSNDTISMGVFEAVIGSLSRQKQLDRIYHWLNQMRQYQEGADLSTYMLSRRVMRYVVMCHLSLDQLEEAVSFLQMHQRNHAWIRDEVFGRIKHNYFSHSNNSKGGSSKGDQLLVIDRALGLFAKDCDAEWRLNEMRHIYLTKRQYKLSHSHVIVRRLIDKCVYTRQSYTARRLLRDTIRVNDTKGTQICAKKLVQWHLAESNVPLAMEVYEELHGNQLHLPIDIFHRLIIKAAKDIYAIDALRMYKECREIYPTQALLTAPAPIQDKKLLRLIIFDTPIFVFRGLIRARQYTKANQLHQELLPLIRAAPRDVSNILVRSLYGLCVHTCNVELFEEVFKLNEQLKLGLTHEGLTSLFALYLKRGDLASAKWAFRQIATLTDGPDIYDFNLLLRTIVLEEKQRLKLGITADGSPDKYSQNKILDVLEHMQRVNLAPDASTLRTLASLTKDQQMKMSLYQRLLDMAKTDPSATTTKTAASTKPIPLQRHQNQRANDIFLNNLVLANILKNEGLAKAADILINNDRGALFPSEQGKSIKSDSITFYTLFAACFSRPPLAPKEVTAETIQPLLIARKLFNIMRSRGLTPHTFVYEKLIQHYAAIGKISKAYNYLKCMEKHHAKLATLNTKHYLPIIDALLRQNKFVLARQLILKELKVQKNIPLDEALKSRLKLIAMKMK